MADDTRQALAGYRQAMTCVLQLAGQRSSAGSGGVMGSRPGERSVGHLDGEPTAAVRLPEISASLLLSLHFMMIQHDLAKHPGQWRPGAVWVSDARTGRVVYEAPDRDLVEPLIEEMLAQIVAAEAPPAVVAAMAHLNLTLIHPFSDGNGRMARCLQTFVLAGAGEEAPEFVSIEEYLGANTTAYYAVLQQMAGGAWSPRNSARPWLEFCLTAHYRQALTLRRRITEIEALWDGCEQLARTRRLADRAVGALVDAARGWQLRRSLYRSVTRATAGEEISEAVATSDLSAMVRAGLLRPVGEKRGRYYEPTETLTTVWHEIVRPRPEPPPNNPYELARHGK